MKAIDNPLEHVHKCKQNNIRIEFFEVYPPKIDTIIELRSTPPKGPATAINEYEYNIVVLLLILNFDLI